MSDDDFKSWMASSGGRAAAAAAASPSFSPGVPLLYVRSAFGTESE